SVDLPTFGRPTMATMPVRATGASRSCMASVGNLAVAGIGGVRGSRLHAGSGGVQLTASDLRVSSGLALRAPQCLHRRLCAFERQLRRRLLGCPAAAPRAANADLQLGNAALDFEFLVVRGAACLDHCIDRQWQPLALQVLLQQRLAVLAKRLRIDAL